MKIAILGALALAGLSAGCMSTQTATADLGAAIVQVNAKVAAAQTTLKKLATNTMQACAYIQPSEGYFADVAGLVSPVALGAEQTAAALINSTCAVASSTNLPSVLTGLSQAWAVVQAATHKPGT